MTGKSKFSESYISSAVEYRKTHSEADTAKKYGVSSGTVRYWLGKRGVTVQRVKSLAPDEQPRTRILKQVPDGFRVPHRRLGW